MALFRRELPLAHSVVESHAWSHVIMELTNDRDHFFCHAKMGDYCLDEDSVKRVVRFGSRVDKHTYGVIRFFYANSYSRRTTNIVSVVQLFGQKPLCSSDRITARSKDSPLSRRAMIFSSILPVCTTSEIPM